MKCQNFALQFYNFIINGSKFFFSPYQQFLFDATFYGIYYTVCIADHTLYGCCKCVLQQFLVDVM